MKQGGGRVRKAGTALAVAAGLLAGQAGCAGDSTGLGLGLVPPEQVRQMGEQAWRQIRSETPASRDATLQARAERVADRLLAAAGETPGQWDVVVFQGQEVNAFALPGRHIGVYEGMMRFVTSDDELAAVIGHEISHVTENHSEERLNTQVATQTGVEIAASAAGAANLGSPERIASILGAGAQYGIAMPYGRNQELEADRLGLGVMARAGYNPQAAIGLWQRMEGSGGPEFLSTHPGPERRIERIRQWLPEVMPVYRANARR